MLSPGIAALSDALHFLDQFSSNRWLIDPSIIQYLSRRDPSNQGDSDWVAGVRTVAWFSERQEYNGPQTAALY